MSTASNATATGRCVDRAARQHAASWLAICEWPGTVLGPPSGPVPYWWETNASWYDPASHRADFVVTATDLDVPESLLITWFGRPMGIYHVPPYTITVWNKNLLPLIR